MAKLKVFSTAIGFHDAYVAATSQKAALEAWGSDKNLFAMGAAQVVTDPKLTAEPLASPGKVIKRTRGSLRDHLSAVGPASAPRRVKRAKEDAPKATTPRRKAKPPPPPPPRPSRGDLDVAEAALEHGQIEAKAELAEIDRRQAELRKERERTEDRQARTVAKLERAVDRAKDQYDRALERWRKS